MDRSARPATQILTRPDGTAVQVVRQASLSVFKGADKGHSVLVAQGAAVCGADHGCDLVLTDPAVSARHFEVRPTPQGFQIADLGSTNGTFVEDLRIGSCFVDSGTVIRVGRTRIRLLPTRERVEIPLSTRERFGRLLGHSVAMRRVFAVLERVAPTDVTFLIEGESGTGKELVADSVHQASPRAEGPLVVVDCGAIPENLVESELFGHERGAFTGADRARAGFFEAASGGTILLDEIGELPLAVQPKLLRVLEQREIKRVGSNATIAVDVRVLAATNRNLAEEVAAGRFREDLYYRLAVLRLEVPPLRERREDIPTLVEHFVSTLAPGIDVERALSADTMAMLRRHDWPGNVRELRNVVERLLVLPELGAAAIPSLGADDGPGEGRGSGADVEALFGLPFHEARTRWQERFERSYLAAKLKASNGVVLHAAEQAQIPRQTFHRLLRKHGL
jgi:DNA-binding NtrC family response regulator